MKIDYKTVYKLDEQFQATAVRLKLLSTLHPTHRSADVALARAEWTPTAAPEFEPYQGVKWYDWVGTQRAPLQLVSVRALRLLEIHGISGWQSLPVVINPDPGGDRSREYRLLTITGRCGRVENARSRPIEKHIQGKASPSTAWKGMYVQDDSWDGSDVFAPGETSMLFISRRVKDVLEKNNVTNCTMIALEDVERMALT